MSNKRFENSLFAIVALIVGGSIRSYYTSALPDFNLGRNQTWITFECMLVTLALWSILLVAFRFIGKERKDRKKSRLWKVAAMRAYWLMVCAHFSTTKEGLNEESTATESSWNAINR